MKIAKELAEFRLDEQEGSYESCGIPDLLKSLEDAFAFELGERRLRVTRIHEARRNCASCEVQGFDRHLGS